MEVCEATQQEKGSILIVDGDINVRTALQRIFRPLKHKIYSANDSGEAVDILKTAPIDVIISDIRLPGDDGVEFLEKVKTYSPEAIRILLTGFPDLSVAIDAINKSQVYQYINKPWENTDLKATIQHAVTQRILEKKKTELIEKTRQQNIRLAQLNLDLENRVNQLIKLSNSLKLTKQKIQHESEKNVKLLNTFRENTTHKLNDINSLLQQTKSSFESPEAKHKMEQILFDCDDILSISNGFYDLEMLHNNKCVMNNVNFNLHEMLENIFAKINFQFPKLDLEVKQSDSLPKNINSDPSRVKQIISSCLSYACNQSQSGKLNFRIFANQTSYGDLQITCKLKFNSVDVSNTKCKLANTEIEDLDLMFANEFAEIFNGRFQIYGDENQANEIFFKIRVNSANDSQIECKPLESIDRLNLLLVEGNDDTPIKASQMLNELSVDYEIAISEEHAIDHIRKNNSFDLVLLSLAEYDKSIQKFCDEISDKLESDKIPFLYISHHPQRGEAKLVQEAGVGGYISNLENSNQLKDFIRYVIGFQSNPEVLITKYFIEEDLDRS